MTVLDEVHEWLGEDILLDGILTENHSCIITIRKDSLFEATKIFQQNGITHITTITALDIGKDFELKYHFSWMKGKGFAYKITLIIQCPKEVPKVPSITPIFPGARNYEQEVQEMLGIQFTGLDSQRLLLPDEWADWIHPLQKQWTAEELKRSIKKNEEINKDE